MREGVYFWRLKILSPITRSVNWTHYLDNYVSKRGEGSEKKVISFCTFVFIHALVCWVKMHFKVVIIDNCSSWNNFAGQLLGKGTFTKMRIQLAWNIKDKWHKSVQDTHFKPQILNVIIALKVPYSVSNSKAMFYGGGFLFI